ncbi:MAG: hypothetical protein SFW66_09725 [Gammaproteobacteria bacterium]|nr:hypothetical protein [Gammaproteobacteria bacterium]
MRKWKSLSSQTRREVKALAITWIVLSILVTLLGYVAGVGPMNVLGGTSHYVQYGADGEAANAFSQFVGVLWKNGLVSVVQLLTLFVTIFFFVTSISLAKKIHTRGK